MTYRTYERYSSITERVYDKSTGKQTSSVLSTQTLTSLEALTSTITYTYASPAESKVIVYKLSHNKKG
jgi:hypothetical protein